MDEVAEDAAVTDLWSTVHPLLAASSYLVLATADADGRPWTTPLFFALLAEDRLLWVSSPQSSHSQNLRIRPEAAMTVFDSHAPIGEAEAVYLEAGVSLLPHDQLAVGCERLNVRLPVGQRLRPDDLSAAAPLRAYQASVTEFSVLVRGGDPRFTNTVDTDRRHCNPNPLTHSPTRDLRAEHPQRGREPDSHGPAGAHTQRTEGQQT